MSPRLRLLQVLASVLLELLNISSEVVVVLMLPPKMNVMFPLVDGVTALVLVLVEVVLLFFEIVLFSCCPNTSESRIGIETKPATFLRQHDDLDHSRYCSLRLSIDLKTTIIRK